MSNTADSARVSGLEAARKLVADCSLANFLASACLVFFVYAFYDVWVQNFGTAALQGCIAILCGFASLYFLLRAVVSLPLQQANAEIEEADATQPAGTPSEA